MKKKYHKGDFLYLKEKKKQELVKTILFFGISALIFLVGYFSTKTKSNYLTIVAVLGCLPASKSAVSTIMYFRIKECSKGFSRKFQEKFGDLGSFHLFFTSYDKNYSTSHVFVRGTNIIAYTEEKKIEGAAFEEHIKTVLNRDGIKNCHVKLFNDSEKYLERMEQLIGIEESGEKGLQIIKTLHNVSL